MTILGVWDDLWWVPLFMGVLLMLIAYLNNKQEQVLDDIQLFDTNIANISAYLRTIHPFKWWVDVHEEKDYVAVQSKIDKAVLGHVLSPELYWVQQMALIFVGFTFGLIFFVAGEALTSLFFWFLGVGETTTGVVLMFQMFTGLSFVWLPVALRIRLWRAGRKEQKRLRKAIPLHQTNLYFALRNGSTTEEVLYALGTDKGSYFAPHFRRAYIMVLSDKKRAFSYLKNVFKGTHFYHSILLLEHAYNYYPVDLLRGLESERYTTDEDLRQELKRERANVRSLSAFVTFLPVMAAVGFVGIVGITLLEDVSELMF